MGTVTHIERCKVPGAHSIERVFEAVRAGLPERWKAEVVRIPQGGKRPGAVLRGLMRAGRCRGNVLHVVGDVQYGAIALPKDRTVVTVHDLGAFERLGTPTRAVFKALYFSLPLRRCAAVTVISEATRVHLIKECPWVEGKVRVIPNPFPMGLRLVRREFSTECPRILIVGTGRMKNVERVCYALRGIRCEVTIVGRLSQAQLAVLDENRIQYRNRIGVSDEEMAKIYESCDMVLFPSLFEGFGLPIIEGQATGRPVVTSRIEPMKSVAGGGAILVDPYSVEDIRRGVQEVIASAERRGRLVEDGIANASLYSAERVAAEYAKVYDELYEQHFQE